MFSIPNCAWCHVLVIKFFFPPLSKFRKVKNLERKLCERSLWDLGLKKKFDQCFISRLKSVSLASQSEVSRLIWALIRTSSPPLVQFILSWTFSDIRNRLFLSSLNVGYKVPSNFGQNENKLIVRSCFRGTYWQWTLPFANRLKMWE